MIKPIFVFCLMIVCALSYAAKTKTILALGDSLTEGYGVDSIYSYPSQLGDKLQALKLNYKVVNGGVSGSTTASGLSRLRWFLKGKPDIMILALGANDGLRGLKLEDSKMNLEKIIKLANEHSIRTVLAGMQMPPNYGLEYRDQFKKIYFELAKKYKLVFIPFFLEGVAGNKKLNIEDGIHPNKEGYKVITENVYLTIKDIL